MLTKEAIQELSQAEAVTVSNASVDAALGHESAHGVVALPSYFEVHDMEAKLPWRRRARSAMVTSLVGDFARYLGEHKETGASVFVDQANMSATAVLNLGTPAEPGHCDNHATYRPLTTAAYKALSQLVAKSGNLSQRELAEFLEDWGDLIGCYNGEAGIKVPHAVAAVRGVTLEALKRSHTTQEDLSASQSTFESVKASGGDNPLPSRITFATVPYVGLSERTFSMRLGVRTGGQVPLFTLQIAKQEEHAEDMAAELTKLVTDAIGAAAPVLIGTLTVKA